METNNNLATQESGKTAGIVSYFTIVGWLIAYFAMHKDKKTELGSYQLRQTLLFHIVAMVLSYGWGFIASMLILSSGLSFLAYFGWIINLGLFILWIIGFIGAINGEKKPIPLIGEKAQTTFPGI